jgi:Spy/CpxP family protein refolding chaperone
MLLSLLVAAAAVALAYVGMATWSRSADGDHGGHHGGQHGGHGHH